jgi:threonine synthase
MITLSTAHPAKFPDAVRTATGVTPRPPDWASIPEKRAETITRLGNDQTSVEAFILGKSRLGSDRTP